MLAVNPFISGPISVVNLGLAPSRPAHMIAHSDAKFCGQQEGSPGSNSVSPIGYYKLNAVNDTHQIAIAIRSG